MNRVFAMIPARMGSQRLKQKNLRELGGVPLISRAIRKCKASGVFDEVWVNSEHEAFGEVAKAEGVYFHQRPEHLGNNQATSEQFVAEFLEEHPCEFVVQVHSIAPLLTVADIQGFVAELQTGKWDCLLSTELIQIECAFEDKPVNFTFEEKTNSQELEPVQRISWSITGWRRETLLAAVAEGKCATYAGRVGYYAVSPLAGHVIKTENDLRIAEALLPLVEGGEGESLAEARRTRRLRHCRDGVNLQRQECRHKFPPSVAIRENFAISAPLRDVFSVDEG